LTKAPKWEILSLRGSQVQILPVAPTIIQNFLKGILIQPNALNCNLHWVAWLVKTVFAEEDKRNLKVIAMELFEIRKLIMELAETLVKMSDQELLKILNSGQDDLKEKIVDNYKEKLDAKLDIAEKEFRS
jgi:hypothetical protein